MKKRMLLILFIIIISAGLMYLGRSLQDINSSKQEADSTSNITSKADKTDVETEAVNNKADANQDNSKSDEADKSNNTLEKSNITEGQQNANQKPSSAASKNTAVNSNTNQNSSANSTVGNTQTQKPNFYIIDTISGKNVLAPKYAEFNGETVADVTRKLLEASNISYEMNAFTKNFSSIGGLKEREAGSSSGWCFYVNGKKPSLGAGSFKLGKGDIVEWRYLENGFLN
jgi:hypothetical protein